MNDVKIHFSFFTLFIYCRYIRFTEAIFPPFCQISHTTKKTKTAIDYLDSWTNLQTSKSSKASLPRSRELNPHQSITPLAILGLFLYIHLRSLERHLSDDFADHKRDNIRKPHLSHPQSCTIINEAQHCTANGKAKNSVHVYCSRRHVKIQK